MSTGAVMMPSPFHPGERALQVRAGMGERIAEVGARMIRDFMPDQHRELFARLPFLLIGSVDAAGHPWASLVVGAPGFVSSPDPRTLRVAALPVAGDPLADRLRPGAALGILGIQLETRRRNRANGRVLAADAAGFTLRIEQSFGNCPKYIHPRRPWFAGASPAGVVAAEGRLLSPAAVALVTAADTFFLATAAPGAGGDDPTRGVDVSHRGGPPGFVQVAETAGRSVLTLPDYRGNFLFNSFGNLALNPAAGLLFVEFATGSLLSLSGRAEVLWDDPAQAAFAGAQRLLRFWPERGWWWERVLPLRFEAVEA